MTHNNLVLFLLLDGLDLPPIQALAPEKNACTAWFNISAGVYCTTLSLTASQVLILPALSNVVSQLDMLSSIASLLIFPLQIRFTERQR